MIQKKNAGNFLDFVNQFVLCRLEEYIPVAWNKKELGGWLLACHPSLPVIEIRNSESLHLGWLLGYPIDENKQILKGTITCDQGMDDQDLSRFESWLYSLGGTFAAIIILPRASRFYLDAAGSLSAVFHTDCEIVASTPTLIGIAEDNQALIDIMGVPESNVWYPFGLTPKKSVERLIPSHYLDLVRWKSFRHWPRAERLSIEPDTESTVQEMAQIITRCIAGVTREYPAYMALTAGQDTRSLLACAKKFIDRITFFTMEVPDDIGRLDFTLAAEIAQHFSLNHKMLECQQATEQERTGWLERTGYCIGGRVSHSFVMLHKLNPNYPIITGAIGSVGRAHFYNKFGATPDTRLTGENILNWSHFPQTPEVLDKASAWLQEVADYDVLTILDLFLIEQRVGCLATPQNYGNHWNVFTVAPFCHRRIFDLTLSLPYEYRIKQRLNVDIIRTQWPELLKFPINNYRGIRGVKKNIRRLRRIVGGYPIIRGVKKIVRRLRKANLGR
ncbi:MAG: hypothetical protein JXA33_07530 [Anaerolineae bacterium]|nr:hypothetical protein [Anaerolineae bacterium]